MHQQQQHQQQHQQQQQQQQQQMPHQLQKQHSHEDATTMHCHTNAAYSEAIITSHCHLPHQPHTHTSPHQSQHHVHDYESASPLRTQSRSGSRQAINTTGHGHAHHHHHQRRRRQHSHSHHPPMGAVNGTRCASAGGSGSLPGAHTHRGVHEHGTTVGGRHAGGCARRHRSVTDVTSTSINAGCHDAACADREVQEILVRKPCCSSSRTELAQYFAEDLYGSSRRPSSCCTSSDYCYQTDSTSLYGSRSSLSRNNSIKSASAAMRKQQRAQKRPPSYTSISLRGLNASRPNSQLGSLTSIFDRAKQIADEGKRTPSDKPGTLERQTSKDALSNDLPEYACSPSPIRWSFLADGKSPTEFDVIEGTASDEKPDAWKVSDSRPKSKTSTPSACMKRRAHAPSNASWKSNYADDDDDDDDDERPSTSAAAAAAARKRRDSAFRCEFEESTTVLFHQEGEAFNNCCNNYIQCNTYLDQDLQITSEDIHQYLSKGNQQVGDVLNNSKNYPFQPSNALEFQYKNNFAANNNNNNNNTNTTNTASSDAGEAFQRYERGFRRNSSKETNLNQNSSAVAVAGAVGGAASEACAASTCSSTPLSPTNINLSSSTNNINIVFNACMERNANEVKFINTARDNRENVVSTEAHHSGYLPYTYPTYDYTNMSSNLTATFDKQLGIDELPKEFGGPAGMTGCGGGSTTSEHSSSLQSPVQTGVSFESFDAASEHNLLSHRNSYQYSPTSRTPLSPGSPASASINPAGDAYMQLHHTHYDYETQHLQQQQQQQQQQHHHHQQHQQQQLQHSPSTTRHGNAFKRVRKRARKYTEFLRKK